MKVGRSVQKAIDEFLANDLESSMLHACNAVDGTAKKSYPSNWGNSRRFKTLLRDNYSILGPMGIPNIDLVGTRFPVKGLTTTDQNAPPDLADVIYGIHRCSHGHGDELPSGFELMPDTNGEARKTTMVFSEGLVRLSDRIIWGLLAVATLAPSNVGQSIAEGYHLTYGTEILEINDWWGRATDFHAIVAKNPPISVKLDFGDWLT